MSKGRWITPDETGESNLARCLSVPEKLQPAVSGALQLLTFADNWEQVGDLTPAECADAMIDVLSEYYESVCDVPQVFPDRCAFFWNEIVIVNGNVLLADQNNALQHAVIWYQNVAALNDEVYIPVHLQSGTYELREIVWTTGASGRQKWYVDTTAQASFVEMYSAVSTANVIKTHTIVIPTDGNHNLGCKMDAKHASSTGYQNRVTFVKLIRTGA